MMEQKKIFFLNCHKSTCGQVCFTASWIFLGVYIIQKQHQGGWVLILFFPLCRELGVGRAGQEIDMLAYKVEKHHIFFSLVH